MILLHPTYFPSIAHFIGFLNHDSILFEKEDNYQKQTYRNRTYVYGANGKQILTVPIKHTKEDNHQKYREVKIENNFPWQKEHWKTLQTAYRTSPFFEFYEDDIAPIFEEQHQFLYDLNIKTIKTICNCLDIPLHFSFTKTYEKNIVDNFIDGRSLVNAKKENYQNFEKYTQVFNEKHGFIPNLSILDLLCNEGPNSINYLKKHKKPL